ncbi:bacterial proteasome activator family protein [Kitasatospora sp. NBC_01266]|uniref:bacterial proteasome activator family protein n=1 Tax=Kitasatospora sp. NBC_01266 TaxID=2903572 RepID=UPI003FA53C81
MTKPLNERPEHEPYQGSTRSDGPSEEGPQQVLIVGPDGMPVGTAPGGAGRAFGRTGEEEGTQRELPVTEMVEQPAKVMRIGSMIKQLLEEVRAAPLDEASRVRLKDIHASSIKELELGLAPELVAELERLSLPFTEDTIPTEAELRIAQAQLVGWLEGLFHGIQTALFAQQMAARAQLEQMRRALPPGSVPLEQDFEEPGEGRGLRSGPYL